MQGELTLCHADAKMRVPITLLAGMRMLGIVGMVGGHANARSVSLKQWAHTPLSDDDFTAVILAISQASL